VAADGLAILIGQHPVTDWADGLLERDEAGYLLTGPDVLARAASTEPPQCWPLARDPFFLETSVPGVFAAGDVRSGSVKRVASAVGEGAMAVQNIHQYLGPAAEADAAALGGAAVPPVFASRSPHLTDSQLFRWHR
jgi:thioredoxin reductase (NADPH)